MVPRRGLHGRVPRTHGAVSVPARALCPLEIGMARAAWHRPSTIYLTYDDGPNPSATPTLLDVLRDGGAHATFFVIDAHVTEASRRSCGGCSTRPRCGMAHAYKARAPIGSGHDPIRRG